MRFENFEIHATPNIVNASCKCGNELIEVANGWFSSAMFCGKCENVYMVKLVKLPNEEITKEFLEQCRQYIKKSK